MWVIFTIGSGSAGTAGDEKNMETKVTQYEHKWQSNWGCEMIPHFSFSTNMLLGMLALIVGVHRPDRMLFPVPV